MVNYKGDLQVDDPPNVEITFYGILVKYKTAYLSTHINVQVRRFCLGSSEEA